MTQPPAPTQTWHSDTYPAIDPSRPELSLVGKAVVITGGGAGLGAAIAKASAQAGVSLLALLGRRAELLEKTKEEIASAWPSTKVLTIPADIAKFNEVEAAFQTIKQQFGQPHVLVNNAAYFGGVTPIIEATVEDWFYPFEVNVKGSAYVTKAFLDVSGKDAMIVNISTAVAHLSATVFPGFSAYGASKMAALRYFEWLQAENPELHVVSIHPGQVTSTEMAKTANGGNAQTIDTEELSANFVVWSMSPEARFLKGRLAWANWDVDELKSAKNKIESGEMFTSSIEGWKQQL